MEREHLIEQRDAAIAIAKAIGQMIPKTKRDGLMLVNSHKERGEILAATAAAVAAWQQAAILNLCIVQLDDNDDVTINWNECVALIMAEKSIQHIEAYAIETPKWFWKYDYSQAAQDGLAG